jgi:predicted nucleic acid-binding protein
VIFLETSVLSAVLRRRAPGLSESRLAARLQALLNSTERVAIAGIVMQELLSGIRAESDVERIRAILVRGYAIVPASIGDHLQAADVFNKCRRKGLSIASVDALIAAVAMNRGAALFAADGDFDDIARIVPLRLQRE